MMKDPTRGPLFACLYPGLCDVARAHGYALAIHGSLVTDMDLIAVPWVEGASDAETLMTALKEHVGAVGYADLLRRELSEDHVQQVLAREESGSREPEVKPHGRLSWNLYLMAGTKIDLSIYPQS